jgi:hypothetical protein
MPRARFAASSRHHIGRQPTRGCEVAGCPEAGLFPAPRSRDRLRSYYWFCLDHVRAYNQQWDYFAGMSEAEIEDYVRAATVWERPSWPLGGPRPTAEMRVWRATEEKLREAAERFREHLDDDEMAARSQAESEARARAAGFGKEAAQAMVVMALSPPLTLRAIKARYKELVKLHHPDANGGDKSAEERLKVINAAYATLKGAVIA